MNAVSFIQIVTWYNKHCKNKLSKTWFAVAHYSVAQIWTKIIIFNSPLYSLRKGELIKIVYVVKLKLVYMTKCNFVNNF